jgi:hypothetical protein
LGGRGRRISEFEASLVYKVSSRPARAIQQDYREKPCLEKPKKKKKKKRIPQWIPSGYSTIVDGIEWFFNIL